MYGLSDTSFLSATPEITPSPPSPLPFPSFPNLTPSQFSSSASPFTYNRLISNELELVQESFRLLNSEMSYSGGSSGPCSSYGSPTSLASCGTPTGDGQRPSLIQRSMSSQSLRKNGLCRQLGFVFDSEGLVRRVYSAGDLQRMNNQGRAESPLSSESSLIIEGMTKACRYSPEEKRERIERYKTKRHQRNFSKKIKYECRKTLADSRKRIRGRFARNIEENEDQKSYSSSPFQYSSSWKEDNIGEDDDSWITFLHSCSPNLIP